MTRRLAPETLAHRRATRTRIRCAVRLLRSVVGARVRVSFPRPSLLKLHGAVGVHSIVRDLDGQVVEHRIRVARNLLPGNAWLTFVHELAHALDPERSTRGNDHGPSFKRALALAWVRAEAARGGLHPDLCGPNPRFWLAAGNTLAAHLHNSHVLAWLFYCGDESHLAELAANAFWQLLSPDGHFDEAGIAEAQVPTFVEAIAGTWLNAA